MALALMLAVPRRIAEGDKVARAGDWNGWSPTGMLGHRIVANGLDHRHGADRLRRGASRARLRLSTITTESLFTRDRGRA